MENQSIRETYKHLDLYGSEIMLTQLKKQFKTVCYTEKSIPTPGSPCKPSTLVSNELQIQKAIFHNSGEITIKTQHGFLKFF